MDTYDYLLKIIIIGDSNVGKSSLLTRYADGTYNETYMSTIGVDFKIHTIKIDDKIIKLQLWDTAGQERFRTIINGYYRGANGVLLVYDVTNPMSFLNLTEWLKEINYHTRSDVSCLLAANKCDLTADRVVSEKEGRELADKQSLDYIETSAKLNQNVDQIFLKLAQKIAEVEGPIIKKPSRVPINLIGKQVNGQQDAQCC